MLEDTSKMEKERKGSIVVINVKSPQYNHDPSLNKSSDTAPYLQIIIPTSGWNLSVHGDPNFSFDIEVEDSPFTGTMHCLIHYVTDIHHTQSQPNFKVTDYDPILDRDVYKLDPEKFFCLIRSKLIELTDVVAIAPKKLRSVS